MSAMVTTRKAGTVDVSIVLRIVDSVDGTPEVGVVFNTTGIDLQYRRELAASTAITEVTLAALTTAHADGGFLHIGNGYYRFDLPDAACASGSTGVLVHGTVTGMVVVGTYIQLVAYDPFDTVRLGLTALPNAASEAAGGLYTRGTGAGQINQGTNGRVDTNVVAMASGVIAAATFVANALDAAWVATTRTLTAGTNIVLAKGTGVTGFTDLSAAQVNAEVVDALNVDTYAEPGSGTPAATISIATKIGYLFKWMRNLKTNDGTTTKFYNDAGSVVDQKQTTTSAAGTVTKNEIVSGP